MSENVLGKRRRVAEAGDAVTCTENSTAKEPARVVPIRGYAMVSHPSDTSYFNNRYRILWSHKKLDKSLTGLQKGHHYFPKILPISIPPSMRHNDEYLRELTTISTLLNDTMSSEEEIWQLDFYQVVMHKTGPGSERMRTDGAISATYKLENPVHLLAFPLFEVYRVGLFDSGLDENILLTNSSIRNGVAELEVVFPSRLQGDPVDFPDIITFNLGALMYLRRYIPNRPSLRFRDQIIQDAERLPCFPQDDDAFRHETRAAADSQWVKAFASRDHCLKSFFGEDQYNATSSFWGPDFMQS